MKRFVLPALLGLEDFSLTFVSNLEEIKVHETQEDWKQECSHEVCHYHNNHEWTEEESLVEFEPGEGQACNSNSRRHKG